MRVSIIFSKGPRWLTSKSASLPACVCTLLGLHRLRRRRVGACPRAHPALPTTYLNEPRWMVKDFHHNAPHTPVTGPTRPIFFNQDRLEHQLAVFLRPHLSQEDLDYLSLSFANVLVQLSSGEPLSPESYFRVVPTTYPIGLCNAAQVAEHAITSSPTWWIPWLDRFATSQLAVHRIPHTKFQSGKPPPLPASASWPAVLPSKASVMRNTPLAPTSTAAAST